MTKSERITPIYFEPSYAGKNLRQVGVDYLQVENQNIVSHWYHGAHDVDLFVWIDQQKNVIKQQISFCGQIVEWNILDGLKTGVVIEEDLEAAPETSSETGPAKASSSETIRFDLKPQSESIKMAIEVIKHIDVMDDVFRQSLLRNFGKRSTPRQTGFWQKVLQIFKKSA